MTHTPHDLHVEFPENGPALHALKMRNARFRLHADDYRDTNRELHRIEIGAEPASDARTEELKKIRLALLDGISGMIAEFERTA